MVFKKFFNVFVPLLGALVFLACPSPGSQEGDKTVPVISATPDTPPPPGPTASTKLEFSITEDSAASYASGVTAEALKDALGTIAVNPTNMAPPTIDSANLDASRKKIVITLTGGKTLVSDSTLTINFSAGKIKDVADNVNAKTTLTATVNSDKTPPELLSITANDGTPREVVLTFSEFVTAEIGDFMVTSDALADPTTANAITVVDGNGTATIMLTLRDDLVAGNNIKVGNYSGSHDKWLTGKSSFKRIHCAYIVFTGRGNIAANTAEYLCTGKASETT